MLTIIAIMCWVVSVFAFRWWASAKIFKLASDLDEVHREFFSTCPPNKIIIIKDGENPRRYISNCRGFDIDQQTGLLYFINKDDPNSREGVTLDPSGKVQHAERFQNLSEQTFTGLLDELWGVHWLGFPPMGRLHSVKSEWNDVTKKLSAPSTPNQEAEPEVDFGFKPRQQVIATFSMMKNYGFVTKGCETGKGKKLDPSLVGKVRQPRPEMVAIDLYIFGTIVIANAYQAFVGNNWVEGVDAVIRRVCTAYSGKYNTDNLGDDGGHELMKELWKANHEILEKYGVVFYHLEYNGWEYSGTPAEKAEIRAISRKVWVAEQEANALNVKTDADANRIKKLAVEQAAANELVGDADNKVLSGRVNALKELGDQAGTVAIADGMGKMKPGVTLSLGKGLSILAQPGKEGKKDENNPAVVT